MIKKSLRHGSTLWVHYAGRTFTVEQGGSKSHRSSSTSEAAHGIIESPMPGKIFKLNCKAGDTVSAGQTVCIIEAMKMEYSLKAPFAGKVKDVVKKPGDQLILGEKILEITRAN